MRGLTEHRDIFLHQDASVTGFGLPELCAAWRRAGDGFGLSRRGSFTILSTAKGLGPRANARAVTT